MIGDLSFQEIQRNEWTNLGLDMTQFSGDGPITLGLPLLILARF